MILAALLSLAAQDADLVERCKVEWEERQIIEQQEALILLDAIRERNKRLRILKLWDIYRAKSKAKEIEI